MTLSHEEAIARLKAEIIAQDWQLPPRRIQPLEEAIATLRANCSTRKHILNLLSMTASTLNYAKKYGGSAIPECIDFLKEAMAHVVGICEDENSTAEAEQKTFDRLYARFTLLKERIKSPAASEAREEDFLSSAAASLAGTGNIEASDIDRRKNSRVPFEATADVELNDARINGCETRDLSIKGVFVVGIPARKTGEECRLKIHLTGTDVMIEATAEVLRATPEGVGLHFTKIDLESYTLLKNILYYNLGDPERIDQEIASQLHSG